MVRFSFDPADRDDIAAITAYFDDDFGLRSVRYRLEDADMQFSRGQSFAVHPSEPDDQPLAYFEVDDVTRARAAVERAGGEVVALPGRAGERAFAFSVFGSRAMVVWADRTG